MTRTAVLFDLGNVLVRLDLQRGLRRMRRLGAARAPALAEAELFFSKPAEDFNRGRLSPEQFLAAIAALVGFDGPPARLAEPWCDIFTPFAEMEALAGEVLTAGHRAYLLSNTDTLHFDYLSRRIPVLGQLTGLHLSYEVGLMKPEPAFFTSALERFGLEASDCAFVDDRPEHVGAARAAGIAAAVHRGDVPEIRDFLRARGVAVGPG